MEVIGFLDKQQRDEKFNSVRSLAIAEPERVGGVVKFSEIEPTMNPDSPGEILLDGKGRVVYHSVWCVAYQ